MEYYGVSERKACRVPGQCRATQRYESKQMGDEELLRNSVTSLASYGYKRITALLNQDGWKVNHKRVFWICREKGLKVPSKQPTHNPPYQIVFKSLTFGLLCGGRVKSGINSGVWSV
jgi:hypothetical protein